MFTTEVGMSSSKFKNLGYRWVPSIEKISEIGYLLVLGTEEFLEVGYRWVPSTEKISKDAYRWDLKIFHD